METLDAQHGGLVFEHQVEVGARDGRIGRRDGRDGCAGRRGLESNIDGNGEAVFEKEIRLLEQVFCRGHLPVSGVKHVDGAGFRERSGGHVQGGDAGFSVDGGHFQGQCLGVVVETEEHVADLPILVELVGFGIFGIGNPGVRLGEGGGDDDLFLRLGNGGLFRKDLFLLAGGAAGKQQR